MTSRKTSDLITIGTSKVGEGDWSLRYAFYIGTRLDRLREHVKRRHETQAEDDESVSATISDANHSSMTASSEYREIDKQRQLCGTNFTGALSNRRANISRHIHEVHEKKTMVYTCGYCEKPFSRANNLRSHRRIKHFGKEVIKNMA